MPNVVLLSPDHPAVLAAAARDRSYRAAIHVLSAPSLVADPRVWDASLFGSPGMVGFHIDFHTMLAAGGWSRGERGLIEVAASLSDPDRLVNLYSLQRMDDENQRRVLEAIAIAWGRR